MWALVSLVPDALNSLNGVFLKTVPVVWQARYAKKKLCVGNLYCQDYASFSGIIYIPFARRL